MSDYNLKFDGTSFSKVVHVVYHLKPGSFSGGVSKMVYELAVSQREQGLDVSIWTVDAASKCGGNEDEIIRSFPGQTRFGIVSSRAIFDELRKAATLYGGSLIVHSHNTFHPLNWQVYNAVRGTEARLFYSPHGALDPVMMKGYSLKALKKRAYVALIEKRHLRNATGLFALSLKECEQLKKLSVGERIHIIPNGIVRKSQPAEDRDIRTEISLGFIGRINEKKGIEHIIHALHLFRQFHPRATLTIAGDRSQFPMYVSELDVLANNLNVASALRWTGFLDEGAKRQFFDQIDVFLHASLSEGMPMAVLEAIEAGVPSIVTPGCYMHFAAEKGAVIEVAQSPMAIADCLVELASFPDKRRALGIAGQRHAWRFHSWDRIVERYAAAYSSRNK